MGPSNPVQEKRTLVSGSANGCFNLLTIVSWLLLCAFLFSQPWLANYANNKWAEWKATRISYDVRGSDFEVHLMKTKFGLCTTPLSDMVCTDGQNFTELAKKYRPNHMYGCGCGEGILGESLCPRKSFGHCVSEYISTAPGLGAMFGLATYPIMGLRTLMERIVLFYHPSPRCAMILCGSLHSFQINFILWSIASVCTFPKAHFTLTVTFLGSFCVFALTVLGLFNNHTKQVDLEQGIICVGGMISFVAITLGAIPRIFFAIDEKLDKPILPDLNSGYMSYSFWFGEVVGLSIFFGLYPVIFLAQFFRGKASFGAGLFKDKEYEQQQKELEQLIPG